MGPARSPSTRDGDLYLALREGNAIYRIAPKTGDDSSSGRHRRARLFGRWRAGPCSPGSPAPKGSPMQAGSLYVADTENHVVRRIELRTGIITTVLGTGQRGDGPEPDPLRCALARPHGVFVDAAGGLYVGGQRSPPHSDRELVVSACAYTLMVSLSNHEPCWRLVLRQAQDERCTEPSRAGDYAIASVRRRTAGSPSTM